MPVRRPVRLSLAAAALIGPLITVGALTAPAAHAAPGPWQVYSSAVSDADFMQFGPVPGHPGNAHTGSVYFDTSDPEPVTVYLSDWQCPAGKTPPRAGIDRDNGDCAQLSEEVSDLPSPYTSDQAVPTFSGPLNATYHQQQQLVSTRDDSTRPVTFNVRWTRVGPATRTVTDDSTSTEQSYDELLTAPMRLTGTVDWVHLGTPRSHTHVTYYVRETTRYRSLD